MTNDFGAGLLRSRASISFFYHRSIAATGKAESVMNVPLCSDARAAGWYAAPGCDPDLAGAIVDLIRTRSRYAVTIGNSPGNPNLLTAITIRVGRNLPDVCLTGAGSE